MGDDIGEGFDVDGFGDVAVAAGFEGAAAVAGEGVGGEGDEGDGFGVIGGFELAGRFPAVNFGDGEVEEDEVGFDFVGSVEAGTPVKGGHNFVAGALQYKADEFVVIGVVFDDEDTGHVRGLAREALLFPHASVVMITSLLPETELVFG